MTNINRKKIQNLVEVIYQPPFKTFYINSLNGKSFVKPFGVFVSLGITTSTRVIEEIRDFIINNGEYNATIAEISSKKVAGQFLNTVTNMKDPEQYTLTEFGSDIMDREKATSELCRLEKFMNTDEDIEVLKTYAPKISKLQELINVLDKTNGWDYHMIQEDLESDYRLFHKLVNYQKKDDLEYRLGIYVSEKSNN